MRPFPSHKLTWFVCRICNRVRAYTASDLLEIPGRIPTCTSCDDGTERFMQRIDFSEESEVEIARREETIEQLRTINQTLDRDLHDRNVLLDRVQDVIDNPRGRSFQAIVERISTILREDEQ